MRRAAGRGTTHGLRAGVDALRTSDPCRVTRLDETTATKGRKREASTKATTANDTSTDDKILRQLNDDYIHSDQNTDVARYEEFLAEDFTATLPDLVFQNRQEFLDLIAQPRPFTGLTLLGVTVRILGDAALLNGQVSHTTKHDGQQREAQ